MYYWKSFRARDYIAFVIYSYNDDIIVETGYFAHL